MRITATLTVALWAAAGVVRGGPAAPHPADEKIRVEHDAETFVTRISIRTDGGRVAWRDVLRGLARARGHDDRALEGVGPDRSFDLRRKRWRTARWTLNLALHPHVHFRVEGAGGDGDPRLVIELDRAALLSSKRRFKARLRDAWLHKRPSQRHYGLELDDGWQQAPAGRNLVVVVHGLDSSPERVADLSASIRREGLPAAAFRYPNDQPIADSARLLARELAQLAEDHPQRGVSLVTFSMGGLVARAALEDPQSDPGNVRQLIMLSPPNHGSALARFGFGLDVWEHVGEKARKKNVDLFYAMVEDGLSEAAADLRPDSPFLRKLNARPRNPRVRYTILLGTGAPLSEADLARVRRQVATAGHKSRWVRFFGAPVHAWLEDLDEVVAGKGDGAVSLRRGRLEGVEDIVVLDFGHLSRLDTPKAAGVRALYRTVLDRLKQMPDKDS